MDILYVIKLKLKNPDIHMYSNEVTYIKKNVLHYIKKMGE